MCQSERGSVRRTFRRPVARRWPGDACTWTDETNQLPSVARGLRPKPLSIDGPDETGHFGSLPGVASCPAPYSALSRPLARPWPGPGPQVAGRLRYYALIVVMACFVLLIGTIFHLPSRGHPSRRMPPPPSQIKIVASRGTG